MRLVGGHQGGLPSHRAGPEQGGRRAGEDGAHLPALCRLALGQGDQWMSWIHRDDLCDLILHSAQNAELSGAVNGTAPEPQTMNTFCRDLAGVLERPMFMPPVPDLLPAGFAWGGGPSALLEGQKVVPNRAQETGFEFKYPKLRQALQHTPPSTERAAPMNN